LRRLLLAAAGAAEGIKRADIASERRALAAAEQRIALWRERELEGEKMKVKTAFFFFYSNFFPFIVLLCRRRRRTPLAARRPSLLPTTQESMRGE
jgi:hypothetical protein